MTKRRGTQGNAEVGIFGGRIMQKFPPSTHDYSITYYKIGMTKLPTMNAKTVDFSQAIQHQQDLFSFQKPACFKYQNLALPGVGRGLPEHKLLLQ